MTLERLLAVSVVAVVCVVASFPLWAGGQRLRGRFNEPLLGDRVVAACEPWVVSDWNVDYHDERLIRVTCYEPKTTHVRETVVER